jgi:hypothetical protein
MAKPTPLVTATKAIQTAQNAVSKVSISMNINGTVIKVGSDTREDIGNVVSELEQMLKATQTLVGGLELILGQIDSTYSKLEIPEEMLEVTISDEEEFDEEESITEANCPMPERTVVPDFVPEWVAAPVAQ